ncbi:MAG: type II toxin-antitoxin system RelE/ParE family toxin [Geobacteraceae bacterium]|nr:type II toxin-antitoxin system RelE/ParE family toxin [Geobacteraceae bacterium]
MKVFHLSYYNETVEAELDSWPVGLCARFRALSVRMEEYGPNLGMPHTRALGDGLFEIRAKAEEGIGRVFFCTMVGRKIIILHSFIKKTDKTPKRELDIALTRQKEVNSNEL